MICKTCLKDRPETDFSKHNGCVGGFDTSRCKPCKKSKWDWEQVSYEKRMLHRTTARAKRRGLECTLTLEDIVLPDLCPVFNVPFIYGDVDWTYSIDRRDNSKGYTKDNIMIMSNKANRLKNNASLADLEQLIDFLRACEVDFDQLGKD